MENESKPKEATSERPEFQAPTGTRDVLAPESALWAWVIGTFSRLAQRAGYGLILGPLFEDLGVFQRVGDSTDIVRKEMYDFVDKGNRQLALRPESTASVVRAFVQHRPPLPFKAWYFSPAFRYERPQAGRLRQHHQLGVEALGTEDADLDVEVIALAASFYSELKLQKVRLRVNSLGDARCRPAFREALVTYLRRHTNDLCDEHGSTFEGNPLRVLDCKRDSCRIVTANAPSILDHLCEACSAHFERVKLGLSAIHLPYEIAPRLVRGIDYYTRTAFEFESEALSGAQNVIGAGGRYDKLAEDLGGPATPGIGFALGVERILLALESDGLEKPSGTNVDVFVVDVTGGDFARDVTYELRKAGFRTDRAFDNRSMKSQLKLADRSGARIAVIIGAEEAATKQAAIRLLREQGDQKVIQLSDITRHLAEMLA